MLYPHFFKAYCRLGICNTPFGSYELNKGVEEAPDHILSTSFLQTFPNYQTTSYAFPKVEATEKTTYIKLLTHHLKEFKQRINQTVQDHQTQIVIGGDHSVSFSSLLALFERIDPKHIGYIQFDSHGDLNTFSSSPSGNFHGMFLRPFIDNFDNELISELVAKKLPSKNVLFIGNLELQDEEKSFFKQYEIKNITRDHLVMNKSNILKNFEQFINSFSHLHISFDVDVFHKSLVFATGTPSQNGFMLDEVFLLLELIAKHPSISLDLTEVNPKKKGAKQTIEMAQMVVITLLNNYQFTNAKQILYR